MSNESRKDKRELKRKKRSPFKIFLVVLLLIFVGAGGAFALYVNHLGKKITSNSSVEAKHVKSGEAINFLLLGVDAGDYNGKDEHQRSDTMMLIRYIPKTDQVYILSIPRDTKVKINGKTQKINAAHAIGGPELTIKTVEELLDVDVNYYGSINYEGFRACVDAIGGLTVIPPRDMKYKASDIQINFNKGEEVHLDGEKAEQFVRWRKNSNNNGGYPTGDVGRAETQQEFMVKFLEKLKSPEGITKLIPLINTATSYAQTNMDPSKILSYGKDLIDVDPSKIEKMVLPGEAFHDPDDRTWYYLFDEEKSQDVLNIYRGITGLSSGDNNTTPLNNENITIDIFNATSKSGLAAQYQKRFEQLGFKIGVIGTYENKDEVTRVLYGGEAYGISNLKNYLQNVKYVKESGRKPNSVKIVLGKDAIGEGIMTGSGQTINQNNNNSQGVSADKSSYTVKILNSTGKSGLAAKYKEMLETKGYKVVSIDNSKGSKLSTTEIGYSLNQNFANTVKGDLGAGKVTRSSDNSADIVIILGTDVID
ncbi:MAG: LCP family protein [Clostridium sp.]